MIMEKYALLIVFISLASYNLMCNGKRKIPELVLANVEALAGSETSDTDCVPGGNGCLSSNGFWWPCHQESQW